MTGGLALYLIIGVAFTALLFHTQGRPTGTDWLWLPVFVLLWPLLVVFAIYMASADKGY